uniref:ATP binding protein n=1 Tax=Rhizophora mucronata TaxID=61149 RepID=A0A2P2J079_RHIMU
MSSTVPSLYFRKAHLRVTRSSAGFFGSTGRRPVRISMSRIPNEYTSLLVVS